jgi:hypothetical protein
MFIVGGIAQGTCTAERECHRFPTVCRYNLAEECHRKWAEGKGTASRRLVR